MLIYSDEENATFAQHMIEESAFTKVVYTKDGPALLIAGFVINVSASPTIGVDVADILSRALRGAARGEGAMMAQGQGSAGADAH
jgi:hypothetical protein